MLTLWNVGDGENDCSGLSRRNFLRVGSLGLTGLSLADRIAAEAKAGGADTGIRDKAVVLLFLAGGASQIETFDPKMDGPDAIRSTTGQVATSIPGVTFGGTFPKLARMASRLAVVRSFGHRTTDHAKAIQHMFTAGNPAGASMGSIYSRLRGPNDAETAMPTYGLVTTDEVDPQYRKEVQRVRESSGPGPYGLAHAPFDPNAGGSALDLMRLTIPAERLYHRTALLESLDSLRRTVDASGSIESMGRFQQKAYDLILRNAGTALDLSNEPAAVRRLYDTTDNSVGFKRKRPCTLGNQLLMARRLIEVGCGFVTVHNAGWDMHADGNNPGIEAGMKMLGPSLDHAVGAFLEDVESRGLSEKILLIITGDFGRTPKINARGGRDHWGPLSTLAFAGGGLKMGQVIGTSSRKADYPGSEPITPADILATVMHTLVDISLMRLRSDVPREIMQRLDSGRPIRDLF